MNMNNLLIKLTNWDQLFIVFTINITSLTQMTIKGDSEVDGEEPYEAMPQHLPSCQD